MQVKLELYRVFKEVAEKGSFSSAANSLFISQSAVSQAIKQLEDAVALPLFSRTAKGVSLTAEGTLLYEYAIPALNLINKGEQKLEAVKNLSAGELKIGASDTISHYLLLDRLERFSRTYSNVKLQIVNRTSIEAISLLKDGKIDLAFFNMPISEPFSDGCVIEKFLTVNDIFVGTKEYAYDKNGKIKEYSLEEIATLPLILLEKKANSRLYCESFFQKNGISISPEIELGSHDLLLEFAKIKLGVSCVIKEFSKSCLDSKELFELKLNTPIPTRNVGVAWLKDVRLSPSAQAFMQI